MNNSEILKTVLSDIWRNYWFLLVIVYPIFGFLFWINRDEFNGEIGLLALCLIICFGGLLFIVGYGIKQFIKIKKDNK